MPEQCTVVISLLTERAAAVLVALSEPDVALGLPSSCGDKLDADPLDKKTQVSIWHASANSCTDAQLRRRLTMISIELSFGSFGMLGEEIAIGFMTGIGTAAI